MGILQDARLRLNKFDTRDISLVSVFSALTAVTTFFAIPLPFGGQLSLGNTVMWIASILFGGLVGGLAGGIGGMIVDVLLGSVFAPFTPFCKFASGLACGIVAGQVKSINKRSIARITLAVVLGGAVVRLAYAPVYLLLFGRGPMLAWLVTFVALAPLITYVAAPIIALAIMKAYPRVMTFRGSRKDTA